MGDTTVCRACPWRLSNQGAPHPDAWYSAANLRRLWKGLRAGEAMSCHPTDPSNPVTPAAAAKGHRAAPEGSKVQECAGALILTQREFMRWQEDHDGDLRAYRKAHPRGLTREGVLTLASRAVFGGLPIPGRGTERALPTPDLNNADVGHAALQQWEPR